MTNDLRVELRTRNNILWHAIFDSHRTVAEFCRLHVVDQGAVGGLLNLTVSPYVKKQSPRWGAVGDPTPVASRLAEITGIFIEELFPHDLYSGIIPQKMVAEIPSHMYRGLNAAKHIALPAAQDDQVEAREAREAIESVLTTLTPREEKVLRLRFGLDEDQDKTLEEAGKDLGCSPERVRQIERKALRKMRHLSRLDKLKPFKEQ